MRSIFLILVCLLCTVSSQAQLKKAIIIASDKQVNYSVQDSLQFESPTLKTSQNTWNQLYLTWERLYIEEGYDNDEIDIFYGYGADFSFPGQDLRYNAVANHLFNITDKSAIKEVILDYLQNLNSDYESELTVEVYFISSHKDVDEKENKVDSVVLHDKELLSIEEVRSVFTSELIKINEIQVLNSIIE